MMTVMNAYYLHSEHEHQALNSEKEQSFVLVRSYRIRKRQITV